MARLKFSALGLRRSSAPAVVRTRSARNSGSSRSAIKNQLLAPGNGGASLGAPILARPGSVALTKNWLSQTNPITLSGHPDLVWVKSGHFSIKA